MLSHSFQRSVVVLPANNISGRLRRSHGEEVNSYASALRECKSLSAGRDLHSRLVSVGLLDQQEAFLGNLVVQMYAKCGSLDDASAVFWGLCEKNVFSWTIMISAYAQNGHGNEALVLAKKMLLQGLKPDRITFVSVVSACSSLGSLAEGKFIHGCITSCGSESDVVVGNALLNMYANCGCLSEANSVFDKVQCHNVVSWTSLIAAYAQMGHLLGGLQLYRKMQQAGVQANEVTFVCVLRVCASLGALKVGESIHLHIVSTGLDANIMVANCLISMYNKTGGLEVARDVFDQMGTRNAASWTAMLCTYAQHGHPKEALELYQQMDVKPDEVTFTSVLDACSYLGALEMGRTIHMRVNSTGFSSNIAVNNALLNMYGKCESIDDAKGVFERMEKNVISWTAMVAAYLHDGNVKAALQVFRKMELEGVKPNTVTYATVLAACSTKAEVETIHERLILGGIELDALVVAALVNKYGSCGSMDDARCVFDSMRGGSNAVVLWNAMISTYVRAEIPVKALELFQRLDQEGVKPNKATFVSIFGACASIRALACGRAMHRRVLDAEFKHERLTTSAIVTMYGKCGCLAEAESAFEQNYAGSNDVVSWNSMIAACVENGEYRKSSEYFRKMELEGVKPNDATFTSILAACSSLAEGEMILAQVEARGFKLDGTLGTALASMYAKFGSIENAREVFARLRQKDVISWNSMLAAYAKHGNLSGAVELLQDMHLQGVGPSGVTFTIMLFAYSHAGLVNEGASCFVTMIGEHDIAPNAEHYRSMVDLLGRAGWLLEAQELTREMPFQQDPAAAMALLNACRMHGDVDRGSSIANDALELEPTSAGAYVLLSNIYTG